MCGRFTQSHSWAEVCDFYQLVNETAPDWHPSWNIAPTQNAGVIVATEAGPAWRRMRWGLVPFWAKDAATGNRLINARADTAADKPAFRQAMAKRRCVVPVSGFYEWKAAGKRKTPYFVSAAEGEPLSAAGLWEKWVAPSTGEPLFTFTILTTDANATLAPLHDRMPTILPRADVGRWLANGDANLLRPCAPELLASWPVSPRVNSPKNDGPDLVEKIADEIKDAPAFL